MTDETCGWCGHPAAWHAEDGCIQGWLWDADGVLIADGCLCGRDAAASSSAGQR